MMVIEAAKASDVGAICGLAQGVGEFEVSEKTVEFWQKK